MNSNLKQPQRNGSPPQNSGSHLFTVGQVVRLKTGRPMRTTRPADTYHITALLPPLGELPQYRIRNDQEKHERLTTQDKIELVTVSQSAQENDLLIAKTFGLR